MEADDWLHIYAERETNKGFIELCNAYQQNKFQWPHHPKHVSLREFVTNFSRNWTIINKEIVPVFPQIPPFPIK